jgi:hypothetical protein
LEELEKQHTTKESKEKLLKRLVSSLNGAGMAILHQAFQFLRRVRILGDLPHVIIKGVILLLKTAQM